ncbi:hypothetical protein M3Y96_00473600 [Aphelenchoides besseyi]|nr:hypothetical protein M3Y96_00473600 [Aphelenchoides besseyi]
MMARDKGPKITYSTVAIRQFYIYLVTKCIPDITLTALPIRDHEQLADMSIDHAKLEDLNRVRLYDGIMSEDDDPPTDHRNNTRDRSEARASAWTTRLQSLCVPLETATIILRINV